MGSLLKPIAFQPIRMQYQYGAPILVDKPFQTFIDDDCPDCVDEPPYCLKTASEDYLYLQMKNEPNNVEPLFFCGWYSFFKTIYSGVFEADDWTLGNGWSMGTYGIVGSYDPANNLVFKTHAAGGNFTPVGGTRYKFCFTLNTTVLTSGNSILVFWGGDLLDTITSIGNGVFCYEFTAANDTDTPRLVMFAPGGTIETTLVQFDMRAMGGTIDTELIPTADGCGFCVDTDMTLGARQFIPDVTLAASTGIAYYVEIEITNRTAGGVGIWGQSSGFALGGGTFYANGIFSTYIIPYQSTKLVFGTTDDFDGCVKIRKIFEQCRSHRAYLIDKNGTKLTEISYLIEYKRDFLTMGAMPIHGIAKNNGANVGDCVRIAIEPTCAGARSENFFPDSLFQNYLSAWALGGNVVLDEPNFTIVFTGEDEALYDNDDFVGKFSDDLCYMMQLNVKEVSGGSPRVIVSVGGIVFFDGYISNPGIITARNISVGGGFSDKKTKIEVSGSFTNIVFTELYFAVDPNCKPDEPAYISNCIQLMGAAADNECMKLVQSSMDVLGRVEFGFLWDYNFMISFRETFSIGMSHYPSKDDMYNYDNGVAKRTSAEIEKTWDVAVARVDENLHDAIALMMKLDWITFSNYEWERYTEQPFIGNEKDYQPNWMKSTKSKLAFGKFEVKKKLTNARFMNNKL